MFLKKLILISLSGFLSVALPFSTQAAEKLQSMDALWNSLEVTESQRVKKSTHVVRKSVAPARQAQKTIKKAKPAMTRMQYQARFKKNNKANSNTKLARQRAAWKAKWDAQQKAKKPVQQIAKAKINKQTAIWKKAAKTTAPQKLTRAQYQLRWKQAQLKKQQKTQQVAKSIVKPRAPQKLSHATFKQSQKNPIINHLPMNVVATLRAKGVNTRGVSAFVQDVNSSRPLLAFQEKTSRVPASVMKLITSYAALGTLGPNYRWPIDVYTKGLVKNGTLNGDLIIKGYGSPEFNANELRKVLQGIRQKGIRNVSGRVVFDNSYFDSISQHAGAFDGKAQSAYNARPDALLFNERLNSFKVSAYGKRVHVSSITPTHNLKIVNRMRKSKRGCRTGINISKRGAQTIATFTGRYSRRCGSRTYTRVISEPANMIYGAMKAMWKRDVGGTLKTHFVMGRAPASARLLLRTHSRTLAEILPTIDKDSNNVMARQLLLTIGAKKYGRGTERNGANAVGAWLASRGLHFPELRIENGSGLSRVARISARHVGDLLMDAYRSPYRNHLMQSLAVAGVDGTMKRRLKRTRVRGRGYFKTGTLRDVRSIAGYVKAADGKVYVMSILHNDPRAKRRALPAHDKLIEWVYSATHSRQLAMK
ncbi:MAG: D-alanyl-D-alanine carboxypeptidase/D-alanyl-D-alanine-endopeptidase [Cocleimonas sp.]